jgi:predicted TIM-barrel fold metal-dependent hydrolase
MPAIDAHTHLGRWLTAGEWAVPNVAELIDLMDLRGLAGLVNLDGRWGAELEANLDRYDRAHPDRFATFCHVDWTALRQPRPGIALAADLARSVRAGAQGLKVWKDLGLSVRDASGELVLPDHPDLTPLWDKAAELDVPVAIHTGDPVAFFDPVNAANERLEELLTHPEWSFSSDRYPSFARLINAFETLVAANVDTTFIGVHVGGYAEDLGWVSRMLDAYPNLHVDIAGRIAELGRQPRRANEFLSRYADRVLFGTDQTPPHPATYEIYFRFMETTDEYFPYSRWNPPPTGRWEISAVGLCAESLARIYAANVRRLLPRWRTAEG